MSKYDAVLAAQACYLDQSYSRGQVVSLHNDETTARAHARKLQKRKAGGGSEVFFVAVHSEDALRKGDIVPELLDKHDREQRGAFHKRLMADILAEELTGKPGLLAAEAGYHLASEGLTLEELCERYEVQVREEHQSRVVAAQEEAHLRARGFETQQTVEALREEFCYSFPAVRGIQAGHEYFSAMIPYRILAKMFVSDDEDVVPAELRAQRQLNPKRADDLSDYILANSDSYVLPSLTTSVDKKMVFEPLEAAPQLGMLHIPMDATMLINDGQHRRYAIERALRADPALERESASVQIHFDQGLARAQQMFADINTKQVKPSSSLNALYDRRNPFNAWTLELLRKLPDVQRRIDFENSVPGARSFKLWSLVAFKKFVTLLTGVDEKTVGTLEESHLQAIEAHVQAFFEVCGEHLPQWRAMVKGDIAAPDVRESFVIGHAVFLEALGMFGRTALFAGTSMLPLDRTAKILDPTVANWEPMPHLQAVDPSKSSELWQNRCVVLGRMLKTSDGVKSTAAQLLRLASIELPAELAEVDKRVNELRR
ncbi:DNA sulfur modification protein DndB [Pseudomonas sp. Marseille-Q5115]|uniref:DNA sulfur modification protein DndB n=1 Tax=Pseudomonas sp. Marseille-Q5115 TaxID=2866593 RepID=UPI001CE434FB|nr:DNA sulfur modification protein DndB [Pseudomonas sp. Marseille-Q5115]